MSKQFNFKKSARIFVATAAAGALLSVPTGVALATNSQNGDQNQAREFSRQRGERQQNDGWWNDWRFGEGKERWENEPRSCQQRQASANRETDRLKRSAQWQLKKITWQVDYQKWYASRHQLQPTGWEALLAEADADKVTASNAINTLANPTIDCAQPIENDKTILQQNKEPVLTALRDYHVDALNITYAVQIAK